MEDEITENVKQAASNSEDTAEQPLVKIDAEGLDSEIHVAEEKDLDTVLANLQFLARRQGFDTEDLLSRSVEDQGQQEQAFDEDLLGWVEQLDEDIGKVEEHIQELDDRVAGVENDPGTDEKLVSSLKQEVEELSKAVEDMPDDVSRHLGELREELDSLNEDLEGLEDYTASLDDDLEALRQQFSDEDTEASEKEEDGSETEDDAGEDDVDRSGEDREKQEEDGSEGLFRSVPSFRNLGNEQRADEVKQVIQENQPITTSEICEQLFGHQAKSGTDAYQAVQNVMQDFRDELEKEKDGLTTEYRLPEEEDRDTSSKEREEEGKTAADSEIEGPESPVPPEPESAEPVETSGSGDGREDFSDHDGRYSLEELREDEDHSVEAEVLKAFQEYGPISIMEAAKVIFKSDAARDEQLQAVKNHLETHSRKDGKRVEETEEDGVTLYEVFGPFKWNNLFYDRHHEIICTECSPGEDAVFEDHRDAVSHKTETSHNSFVSAQIPNPYQNGKTIKKVIERECGSQ